MPRPGPRPYECVRRAWHSDRHRPMRGSIIQQIFRVVNESHSPATKKNKEWQEKLPIVVLKAEEIMYSKANSEAEYMNLDTIWDRVNDAINTIIRRDESSETGELLPPCIEAALNLGCIPVRASRSQRHSNPRTYLSSRAQEPAPVPPRTLDKTIDERCHQMSLHSANQLNFVRAATNVSPTPPVLESNRRVTEYNNLAAPRGYPFLYENVPPGRKQLMTMGTSTPVNLGSVYPLYYGTHYQTDEPQFGSRVPENTNSNTIFVGTPVGTSMAEPAEMGIVQNLFSCSGNELGSHRITQAECKDTHEKPLGTECDLSLRLGQFSDPCMSMEKSAVHETKDVAPSSSQEAGKFSALSSQRNKEFCFFPGKTANDRFDSYSSNWFPEGNGQNLEATIRKRKAPYSEKLEDGQFCWQPELPSNQFIGRM